LPTRASLALAKTVWRLEFRLFEIRIRMEFGFFLVIVSRSLSSGARSRDPLA
jgi:hypothetical protein